MLQKREIPPLDNVYQAMQEARAASDYYHQVGQVAKKFTDSLQATRKRFDDSLKALQQQASNCSASAISELKNGIRRLGADSLPFFELEFGFGSDTSADFTVRQNELINRPGADFCTAVKKKETWAGLQSSFSDYLDKASKDAAAKAQWAADLESAWNERAHTLGDKLKPGTRISGQLPWIVAILGLFGIAMLLVIWVFSPEIQLELVTSGQIVQFPTVVILLVVLVILGLSDKIADNTLSALLGGLAGYVLSQGVGRASERAAERRASLPPGRGSEGT
jgi:hypothetical protein